MHIAKHILNKKISLDLHEKFSDSESNFEALQ